MNLPIMDKGKVAMVIGVGNKTDDYTKEDAKILDAFMGEVWKVLKQNYRF